MKSTPVWVISLLSAENRREAIASHLSALGIQFEFVDAVDGRLLGDETLSQMMEEGYSLPKGHIGCYLSHLEAYRRLVATGTNCGLILEDDARLSAAAVDLLHTELSVKHFDYCFLDWENTNNRGPVFYDAESAFAITGDFLAHELSDGPTTTHAYFITREAAERRLECALPIRGPIDTYDKLSCPIRFAAVVKPRLAWLSEYGLESFTFDSTREKIPPVRRWLKKSLVYYIVRDWLLFKQLRWAVDVRRRVRSGSLPAGRKWVRLPSGKEIVFEN